MVGIRLGKKHMCTGMLLLLLMMFLLQSRLTYAAQDAEAYAVTVMDEASLLMEEEVDWLESEADKLAAKSGWNVIVATCTDAEGRSAQEVCEANFNSYTAGDDGISCLIDMDNREIYLATTGEAVLYLTDKRIDSILDEAYEAVSDEDYAQCLHLMLLRAGEVYDKGMPENVSVYDEDTGKTYVYHKLTIFEIIGAIIAAVAAGGIVAVVIIGKYRLKWGTYEYDFHKFGSIQLEKEEDRFINQTVTRRHIPQNTGGSSGGGKSSVHSGSGGRSFGGGGRKF